MVELIVLEYYIRGLIGFLIYVFCFGSNRVWVCVFVVFFLMIVFIGVVLLLFFD